MIDFDNLIARSQQIARLTATSRHSQDPESSESLEVDDATALSSQGTSTSDRTAASLERLEPYLEEHAQNDGPETPAPLSAGLLSSRPRSAPGLPIPSLKGQRHHSLYFLDGNILLAAPSTVGEYIFFRVHKSTLSFHSRQPQKTLPTVKHTMVFRSCKCLTNRQTWRVFCESFTIHRTYPGYHTGYSYLCHCSLCRARLINASTRRPQYLSMECSPWLPNMKWTPCVPEL
jgi:hypothetical protein